jgi:hypothetical protein
MSNIVRINSVKEQSLPFTIVWVFENKLQTQNNEKHKYKVFYQCTSKNLRNNKYINQMVEESSKTEEKCNMDHIHRL